MDSLTLFAPAKINLYLKVLKKRPDSYHEIETIFAKLDLADEIVLKKSNNPDIRVFCDDSSLRDLNQSDNLCYKAAKMLFSYANMPQSGVDISIKKNIPVKSGLGGGSSDAAAALIGVNNLFSLGFEKEELMKFASKLGADVPFFVFGYPYAVGRGIGDLLEGIDCMAEFWVILLFKEGKKSTKDIYNKLNLNLTNNRADVKMTRRALEEFDLKMLSKSLFNDLELVVIKEDMKIREALRELSNNTIGARVTGSGPTIFGIVENKEVGKAVFDKLNIRFKESDGWKVILAKTKVTS